MDIIVSRGTVVEFKDLPAYSIALDGYCRGPAIDPAKRKFSFDHHEDCVRLVTKSTCEQVADALALGLDPRVLKVHVNDVDADTVLSVWALRRADRHTYDRRMQRFYSVVSRLIGLVDAHGPAIVASFSKLEEQIVDTVHDHVLVKIRQSQRDGSYQTLNLETFLYEMVDAFDAWAEESDFNGAPTVHAGQPDPLPELKVTFGNQTDEFPWAIVQTDGFTFKIFNHLYRQGIDRLIVLSPLKNGNRMATIARKSDLVAGFDVTRILTALKTREPGWGGGSSIGGSPRPEGTALTDEELMSIINENA